MTQEELKQITEQFNTERHKYPFPTIDCAETAVADFFKIYPELNNYSGEELMHRLAVIVYRMAFD